MQKIILTAVVVLVVGAGVYLWQFRVTETEEIPSETLLEEHADQSPDLARVVSESIVGRWQSNEDAKFIREFKVGGTAADYYDGKVASADTWKAFTKEKPVDTFVPLEDNTPYLQMVTEENRSLIFKVAKLTPESLELVYMDRGGMLTFTRIK